ncbi:MAG: HAMP domain-containing histidine kinase, partial [Oscillospiraceae bacterium]|nr:HAMP domain-containing histidine kinase [Oscillospiraceae bacterium]
NGLYITKPYFRPGVGVTLVMAKPVYTPQHETMVLLICAPMAPVEDTQTLLQSYMLIISAVSLGAAMVIAYLSSRMFVRPIQDAERAANRVALGDYSERMNSKDGSELGDLARALDHMADQLSQLESMRRDFIATVSHQFKTPLSIIQGHTEWVQDSLPGTEEEALRGSFDVITDEIARLDRMCRDILKLSELQSAAGPQGFTDLPLRAFCQDILHSLEILATDISFALDIPPRLRVKAHAADLEHVFRNILQNAILHSGASRVDVRADAEGDRARVTIRDDGKGMTAEQAAHVWDRFYKGNQQDRSGSGLGMSIAAAVIANHGGAYGVESAPGKGTAIWFTLPV